LFLRNLALIRTDRDKVTTQNIARNNVAVLVEKHFGIASNFTEEAVNELSELKDTWN